jgi:hypothetical protein
MAFLDNSGDIILDAVLTDEGRRRLAEGKGTFRIAKFALGDDEIDYSLYNKADARGSEFYDIEILQTPIFEAFTNNASSMHSKIITINNPNLLYLPVIKLNDQENRGPVSAASTFGVDTFLIPVDKVTNDLFTSGSTSGVIRSPADGEITETDGAFIRLDQGLDTTAISPGAGLSADLREDTFIIEMDNRLGGLISPAAGGTPTTKTPSNVDDDDIATYMISATSDTGFVSAIRNRTTTVGQVIAGPRGNRLQFRVRPKINLAESDYYFDLFGSAETGATIAGIASTKNVKYIDSFVTIYGASTGYTVQVPIRFFRVTS